MSMPDQTRPDGLTTDVTHILDWWKIKDASESSSKNSVSIPLGLRAISEGDTSIENMRQIPRHTSIVKRLIESNIEQSASSCP